MDKPSNQHSAAGIRARVRSALHIRAGARRTETKNKQPAQTQDEIPTDAMPLTDHARGASDKIASGNLQDESWSDFLASVEREAASTEGSQSDDVEQLLEPHVDETEQEPALITEFEGNNIEQLFGIIHKTRMKAGRARAEQERSPIIEREPSNGDQCTFQIDTNAQAVAKIQLSFATELESYNSKERTCICGRHTRVEEHRPCPEPPVLDYSAFEEILAAQKELDKEKGSQDIAWRTESMDTVVEQSLLARYTEWVWERLDEGGSQQGSDFLRGLQQELRLDFDEARLEMLKVAGRHRKRPKDFEKLFTEIRSIARQNIPGSVEDLQAVQSTQVTGGYHGKVFLTINRLVVTPDQERLVQNVKNKKCQRPHTTQHTSILQFPT